MKLKNYLEDIRFWIFLFFVIRCYGITLPPLEVEHNWRQTTVTMAARNFLEIDNNILYPRIDINGEKTGISGMEFPFLNYLIYGTAKIFGYQHWYGRLINLIISSLGLWYFFLLIRKIYSQPVAFYSTIVLSVSVWFQFSRKIMPDTFSVSFIIASLYYGLQYFTDNERRTALKYLIISALLTLLGILSKLPSAYLLIVYLFLYLDKSISLRKKLAFALVNIFVLIPVAGWYFYWVPYISNRYECWHFFMGKGIGEGAAEIWKHLGQTLSRFYDTALKFIGFTVFLVGLILSILNKESKIYLVFIFCLFSFGLIILKAGFTFPHHSYYIIPFVPVMSLVAGYGLSLLPKQKLTVFLLFAISIEGIANQFHDFRLNDNNKKLINLESDLNQFSSKNDLILINSGKYPTPMYFAHRKGWVAFNEEIQNSKFIDSLQKKGLKYIVILKRSFGKEMSLKSYSLIKENMDYAIYKPLTP